MNIDDVENAQMLIRERRELLQTLNAIETAQRNGTGWLGVTFEGRYQDESILSIVRPVVASHLRDKIERIESQLKRIGVTIDA